MKKIENNAKTLKSWEEELLPIEMEALHDRYHNDPTELLTPNEVFECIVEWNGGIASAYHIKRLINRVYGIEL